MIFLILPTAVHSLMCEPKSILIHGVNDLFSIIYSFSIGGEAVSSRET